MSRMARRPGKPRKAGQRHGKGRTRREVATDILILSDGTVLAHNLTPGMAKVLHKLNPKDKAIKARAGRKRKEPTDAGPPGPTAPPTA
jgi:hypothetical protein